MKRLNVIVILILAFAGLADSLYLAQHEVTGTPLLCTVEYLTGCNIVANSVYSHIFGVPIAAFAVVLYGVLFVVAALELLLYNRFLRRVLQGIAVLDIIVAVFSTIIQVFLIKALCIYCLVSSVIAVIILLCATKIEPFPRRVSAEESRSVSDSTRESLPMPPA